MRAYGIPAPGAEPRPLEAPVPRPGPGELLVRLGGAGVNPADWKFAEEASAGRRPAVFPIVFGYDGAGTVEALGTGTTRFAEGDSVFGNVGRDPVGSSGTYAQYVTALESGNVGPLPRGLSPTAAAAAPIPAMTALATLDALAVKPGETLLVVGATGGVGSFAVQIGRHRGGRVLATARVADHDFMRALGASELYDWTRESIPDRVRAAHPNGVDALLDTVSDPGRFAEHARLVRRGGVVASTVLDLQPRRPPVEGVRVGTFDVPRTPGLFPRVREMLERGELEVPLEAEFPLSRASEAVQRLRRGPSRGRVAIAIP